MGDERQAVPDSRGGDPWVAGVVIVGERVSGAATANATVSHLPHQIVVDGGDAGPADSALELGLPWRPPACQQRAEAKFGDGLSSQHLRAALGSLRASPTGMSHGTGV